VCGNDRDDNEVVHIAAARAGDGAVSVSPLIFLTMR
jgi:hypothetical protein